jgi:predicted nucleotidyltransferase
MPFPAELSELARQTEGLRLLVLHGSRAAGTAHERSDWDFGYEAGPDCDIIGLSAALGRALGTDDVDLVDLQRASGLLRYRVARESILLFQHAPHSYEKFVVDALGFWFDAGNVITAAQETVLGRLG